MYYLHTSRSIYNPTFFSLSMRPKESWPLLSFSTVTPLFLRCDQSTFCNFGKVIHCHHTFSSSVRRDFRPYSIGLKWMEDWMVFGYVMGLGVSTTYCSQMTPWYWWKLQANVPEICNIFYNCMKVVRAKPLILINPPSCSVEIHLFPKGKLCWRVWI
jgi:hypothetical protein